jgi:hypothetical protein
MDYEKHRIHFAEGTDAIGDTIYDRFLKQKADGKQYKVNTDKLGGK